jgi:Protein related to penicillin acylase
MAFQKAFFPDHMSFSGGGEQGLLRATKMVSKREFHSMESFKEYKNDFISEPARTLLPLMGKELCFQYDNIDPDDINEIKTRSLELLTNWNGNMMAGSPEPLIYATWIETFIKMLLEDELSFNPSSANMANPLFLEKVLRNYKNAEAWCDIKHSDKIETCVELSEKSLTKSLRKLKEIYGSNVDSWRWGDERRINHPSFSDKDVLIPKFLQEISSEISGSEHTLKRIMLRDLSNYKVAKGSSFKMIIDFSSPN